MTNVTSARIQHATIEVQRHYDVPPAAVYQALADAEARKRWGAPGPDQEIVFEERNFSEGGREVSRCGPKGSPNISVEAQYVCIVPCTRIVFTEKTAMGEAVLSLAVVSIELGEASGGTDLLATIQVAATP